MHVCEVIRCNDDHPCKNSGMHATVVRCKWKLKGCFYKLTYIKMTTTTHRNQVDTTHTKRKTKNDRNAARDVKSGLTLKQLSWMCRWLLNALWDVKAESLMWGKRSAVSGSWFSIKSKMWHACHKSRKSDTWWEVSEMILACKLLLLKVDPWIKGCLCMLPWEKKSMHAN